MSTTGLRPGPHLGDKVETKARDADCSRPQIFSGNNSDNAGTATIRRGFGATGVKVMSTLIAVIANGWWRTSRPLLSPLTTLKIFAPVPTRVQTRPREMNKLLEIVWLRSSRFPLKNCFHPWRPAKSAPPLHPVSTREYDR